MRTVTYNFQEVTLYGQKVMKCAGGCGRRLTRKTKFFQTLNPFNKNSAGTMKTKEEILNELRAEKAAWEKEKEFCIHCEK